MGKINQAKEIAASQSCAGYWSIRMDICKECDRYNSKVKSCKECGCFMPAKVLLKKSFCPLLKWKPI